MGGTYTLYAINILVTTSSVSIFIHFSHLCNTEMRIMGKKLLAITSIVISTYYHDRQVVYYVYNIK